MKVVCGIYICKDGNMDTLKLMEAIFKRNSMFMYLEN